MKIAQSTFSLDDIEFKILGMDNRNSFYKFVCKLFRASYINRLAIESVDYSLKTKLYRTILERFLIPK
jgi:hypothetical protein